MATPRTASTATLAEGVQAVPFSAADQQLRKRELQDRIAAARPTSLGPHVSVTSDPQFLRKSKLALKLSDASVPISHC